MTIDSRTAVLSRGLPRVSYRRLIVAALVLIVPVALIAPFYSEPFERDEGVFATLAQTILGGEVPYRDAWDHKPPLTATWYAASFLVFGETIEAPRIAASVSAAATALIVFFLVKRMFDERAAICSALLFGLAFGIPYLQVNANSEVFLVLPLVASLYAFVRAQQEGSVGWLAASGAIAGVAFMTKQVAMWNLFALAGFLVYEAVRRDDWPTARRKLTILGGAALLATLPFFAYFAAFGAADDFFYAIFTYNELFARQVPILERLLRMFIIREADLALSLSFLLIAGAASALMMHRKGLQPQGVLLLLWVVGSYIGVKTSGRDYPHYYVQLLPGLAILSGVLVSDLAGRWRQFQRSELVLPAVLAVALVVSVAWSARVYTLDLNSAHEAKFSDKTVVQADFEAQAIADYVRLTTSPSDTIFNLGRESQLYFLADRQSPTQFFYDRSFWLEDDTFDEALNDLRSRPPTLIIDSLSRDLVGSRADDLPAEFSEFLRRNYDYVGKLHYAQIYRLRSSPFSYGEAVWQSQLTGMY